MEIIRGIQNNIYEIRGERVILDRDLAILYETETKRLKELLNLKQGRYQVSSLRFYRAGFCNAQCRFKQW